MSEKVIKYLTIALGIVLLIIFADSCNSWEHNKLLKQKNKELNEKIDQSKARVDSLVAKNLVLEEKNDSLSSLEAKIIVKRETIRDTLSQYIQSTDTLTETEADSILESRFVTSKANLKFVRTADSLYFEHHTLTELYSLQREKLQNAQLINKYKDGIIKEKDIQLGVKTAQLDLKDLQLKAEKKKKPMIFLKGVAVGITGTALLLLLAK